MKVAFRALFRHKNQYFGRKNIELPFYRRISKAGLEQILEVLEFSLNIEIEKQQNEFTLKGEGCNN